MKPFCQNCGIVLYFQSKQGRKLLIDTANRCSSWEHTRDSADAQPEEALCRDVVIKISPGSNFSYTPKKRPRWNASPLKCFPAKVKWWPTNKICFPSARFDFKNLLRLVSDVFPAEIFIPRWKYSVKINSSRFMVMVSFSYNDECSSLPWFLWSHLWFKTYNLRVFPALFSMSSAQRGPYWGCTVLIIAWPSLGWAEANLQWSCLGPKGCKWTCLIFHAY